jgi:hypothetical protein
VWLVLAQHHQSHRATPQHPKIEILFRVAGAWKKLAKREADSNCFVEQVLIL